MYGLTESMLSKRLQLVKSQLPVISDSGNSSEEDTLAVSLRVRGKNKYCVHQVFSDDQETMLSDYLTTASAMHYGLTNNQASKLAYEYAVTLKTKFPSSWERDQKVGLDWIKGSMKHHQQLSLHKPENMSLARATASNKTNVDEFFDNYTSVMDRYHFPPNKIFNLDETGVSTVLPSPKIIAETGKKTESVSFAKDHGIILLTIPPHRSHRMEPLDISVFGPFKAALRVGFNDLTRSLASQDKVIRMENIASLVGVAYINSFTPKNILSSLSKTGIWPLNRLIFSEENFLCSYVSDRPLPNEATNEIHGNYPEEDPVAVAITPKVSFENVEVKRKSCVIVTSREPSRPVPLIDSDEIETGDFLMIKFTDTKYNTVFYLGKVQVKGNEEYEVKYLREKGNKFVFPDVDDISAAPR
ncbi:hypothetical protein PR048_020932 [Dryococelus australis]|uniref:DDE-1 domain-containing protein n=1 Tax=Dryococelus australis TaxID=614101 RepID=A0ABQ9GWT6_9NEOP|nr:hypothetical protein PR048_020932 [Dryococelus australis]